MKVYLLDQMSCYAGESDVDPMQALPRCTLTPPPAVVEPQVAQFTGVDWIVLDAYPVPQFDYAKSWSNIKAIRDRKTQRGGYKVGQNWFHSDTFSRTQQLGLVMMGAAMPTGLQWKTMNGSFIEMTPTLAQAIFAAAGQQDSALFTYAEQLHAQVQSAQDPATVDLEAGWPETFENV
jgi:hypothetical protein